ncbi:MAG TPA: YezD family protein [Spongiibacteraceae bacterium]|nr:YezD family protein [Spongiibacteraceae bacterium]
MSVIDKPAGNVALQAALLQIAEAAQSIRYGSIEIVIHEGRIVQIERREKVRIETGK